MKPSRDLRGAKRRERKRLLEENETLRSRLRELDNLRCRLPEDVLTLCVLEMAPFTVWACRRDFTIVLWNHHCEQRYACPRSEAIGKCFFDLFANELERDQAKADCLAVIDDGKGFFNFIADDVDRNGKAFRMLTNCFRVYDPRSKQYLQAEIGIDISDLRVSEERHRSIKELARHIKVLNAQSEQNALHMAQLRALLTLKEIHMQKRIAWQEKNNDLQQTIRLLSDKTDGAGQNRLTTRSKQWAALWEVTARRIEEFEAVIAAARESSQLVDIQAQLSAFGSTVLPDLLD